MVACTRTDVTAAKCKSQRFPVQSLLFCLRSPGVTATSRKDQASRQLLLRTLVRKHCEQRALLVTMAKNYRLRWTGFCKRKKHETKICRNKSRMVTSREVLIYR